MPAVTYAGKASLPALAQRLRLVSGLILFLFVLTHFLNHAAGLFGLGAMEAGQSLRQTVTRSLIGSVLIYGAFLVHMVLGLWRLATRATLRMPGWEAAQLVLGILIPFVLLRHVIHTRYAAETFSYHDYYAPVLTSLWPGIALQQSFLLLVVWIHGCIGIHFWLRHRESYQSFRWWLLVAATLVPALALSGFIAGGRELAQSLPDAAAVARLRAAHNAPQPIAAEQLALWTMAANGVFASALAFAFLTPMFRIGVSRYLRGIAITYDGTRKIHSAVGPTLLEISRANGIPHAAVCGGRARCSTCRVRVLDGAESLPPPDLEEARTLSRVAADANVRLACQIRPRADLGVRLLVNPIRETSSRTMVETLEARGLERTLAVMFIDLRGFTSLSENRLPYDVVYILNRFFAHTGEAIVASGGTIDKYLGDGLIALFGQESEPADAARAALRAASAIDVGLDIVTRELEHELRTPLRLGIGIHLGPLVIGRIGHPRTAAITVIGRTVNTAARLEALTKELDCQLVASLETIERAGIPLDNLRRETVQVRGLSESIDVVCIDRARDLVLR